MEKKKPWMKYMDVIHPESELLNVYRELRHAFNREGWTEKDLERPPYYPKDIMSNFQKYILFKENNESKIMSKIKLQSKPGSTEFSPLTVREPVTLKLCCLIRNYSLFN